MPLPSRKVTYTIYRAEKLRWDFSQDAWHRYYVSLAFINAGRDFPVACGPVPCVTYRGNLGGDLGAAGAAP